MYNYNNILYIQPNNRLDINGIRIVINEFFPYTKSVNENVIKGLEELSDCLTGKRVTENSAFYILRHPECFPGYKNVKDLQSKFPLKYMESHKVENNNGGNGWCSIM